MEKIENVWKELKINRRQKAKETLILHYAYLVKYVAGRIAISLPSHIEMGDLIGSGVIGLMDAIEKFNFSRGIKFETYATSRIRGAIMDELRSLDWTPRSSHRKARLLEKAYTSLENKLGRPASDEEVAEFLRIDLDALYKLINEAGPTTLLSLDAPLENRDRGATMLRIDTLENSSAISPASVLEREEMKDILAEAIGKLPAQEKLVIALYYYEGLILKEIGKTLGISESRVSQIHTKAIHRLRGKLKRAKAELVV